MPQNEKKWRPRCMQLQPGSCCRCYCVWVCCMYQSRAIVLIPSGPCLLLFQPVSRADLKHDPDTQYHTVQLATSAITSLYSTLLLSSITQQSIDGDNGKLTLTFYDLSPDETMRCSHSVCLCIESKQTHQTTYQFKNGLNSWKLICCQPLKPANWNTDMTRRYTPAISAITNCDWLWV